MKNLARVLGVGVLGAFVLATGVQAGGLPPTDADYECNESGYFCDGTTLYEVNVNCLNLEEVVEGGLFVETEGYEGSGFWGFFVSQNADEDKDWVCQAAGIYGDQLKTEMKCTDALKGSNKPHPIHGGGYPQADFEIKLVEEDSEECYIF